MDLIPTTTPLPNNFMHVDVNCVLALGSIVNFLQPQITPIRTDEIRIHITNMCRYNGAIVIKLLDHEALVTVLAQRFRQFRITHLAGFDPIKDNEIIQTGYASIHDHPEVYLGDVVSGLKRILGDYKQLERMWEPYVHDQLGMPMNYRNDQFVKALDLTALALEMKVGGHPVGPCAVEKYKVIYDPQMDTLAKHIIFELSPDEKWDIIERSYLAGRETLQGILDEREERENRERRKD